MELRAVARCPSRSMTVLGDLAQATAPGAQSSWADAVLHLGSPPSASIEELELGYRVPGPILDVANRLLPSVAPGVRAARSVRVDGPAPELVPATPDDLPERTAGEVPSPPPGHQGLIVPERWRRGGRCARGGWGRVRDRHPRRTRPRRHAPRSTQAKGLEFDAVVVVEPSAIHTDERGGRLLYIAPHPGVAGARHRPRRLRSRRPWPPDEGPLGRRQYAQTRSPPPAVPSPCTTSSSDSSRSQPSRASDWPPRAWPSSSPSRASARPGALTMRGSTSVRSTSAVTAAPPTGPPHHPPGRSIGNPSRWRRSQHTVDAVLAVEDAGLLRPRWREPARHGPSADPQRRRGRDGAGWLHDHPAGGEGGAGRKRRPSTARPARPCSPDASRR